LRLWQPSFISTGRRAPEAASALRPNSFSRPSTEPPTAAPTVPAATVFAKSLRFICFVPMEMAHASKKAAFDVPFLCSQFA
jgi:hypothetical protein